MLLITAAGPSLVAGPRAATEQLDELRRAPVQHLRGAVEDLAAVHRRTSGPTRKSRARGTNRVAQVLARAARHVDLAIRPVGPAGLGAHELPVHKQLVGLAHVHQFRSTYGRRPCTPPSRPKPDSL